MSRRLRRPDGSFISAEAIADAVNISELDEVTGVQDSDLMYIQKIVEAVAATGKYTVGVNPTANDTILFNGVTYTFKASSGAATEITLGTGASGSDTNLGITIFNLITALNASANTALSGATYSDNHTSTNKNATEARVTFDTAGTAGNTYTLGTNTANIVRSAATLAGGTAETISPFKITIADLATALA